jgi:hypothetical protein
MDDDLAPFFGAEQGMVKWHQAAQLSPVLCRVLDGLDRYRLWNERNEYPPVIVPVTLLHRAKASLIRAVDAVTVSREAVAAVALAVAAGDCRVVGGVAELGVLTAAEGDR